MRPTARSQQRCSDDSDRDPGRSLRSVVALSWLRFRAASSSSSLPSALPSAANNVAPGEAWIVYQRGAPDGEDGVFLIRPDGTGYHQLVPDMAGSENHPEWSADGSQIAFVHGAPDGTSELWVIDADGTDAHLVYTCAAPCNEVGYPDWSPDGAAIFFSENADVPAGEESPRTFRIGRLVLADGSVDFVRARDDGLEMWQARVSPDGETIAYEAGNEELGAAIFTAPVAGGDEFRVTDWELMGAHPDWTSDGRIVFHEWDLSIFPELDQPANMYIVDATGATRAADPLHRERVARRADTGRTRWLGRGVHARRWARLWHPPPGLPGLRRSSAALAPIRADGRDTRLAQAAFVGSAGFATSGSASDQRIAGQGRWRRVGGSPSGTQEGLGRRRQSAAPSTTGSRSPAPRSWVSGPRSQPARTDWRWRCPKGCNGAPDRCWARDNSLRDPGRGPR